MSTGTGQPMFSFCAHLPRISTHSRKSVIALTMRRRAKPRGARGAKKVSVTSQHFLPRRPVVAALATTILLSLAMRAIRTRFERDKSAAPVFGARVVAEFDHDKSAFTQGLAWWDGRLYESTGLHGQSSVRLVDVESGKVLKQTELSSRDFGEGLTVLEGGQDIMQVLWKTGKGYLYDRISLERKGEFEINGDGWGVAASGKDVFLSDGSSTIRVLRRDGERFVENRRFVVRDGVKEVGLLNELEVINGEIWANVWMSDFVARIDPRTGIVNSWVDLRNILAKRDIPSNHQVDVLNGIVSADGRIIVTGKLWPKMYHIRVTNVIGRNISELSNAFFLDPQTVDYVHKNVIA